MTWTDKQIEEELATTLDSGVVSPGKIVKLFDLREAVKIAKSEKKSGNSAKAIDTTAAKAKVALTTLRKHWQKQEKQTKDSGHNEIMGRTLHYVPVFKLVGTSFWAANIKVLKIR